MKLDPEVKELRKEIRELTKFIDKQGRSIQSLEESKKKTIILYSNHFISPTLRRTLTSRELKVLEMRFGMKDGIPKSLEKVGEEFGTTRERIRQIEVRAMVKIRGRDCY